VFPNFTKAKRRKYKIIGLLLNKPLKLFAHQAFEFRQYENTKMIAIQDTTISEQPQSIARPSSQQNFAKAKIRK
jgi:hypothetical protein